MKFRKHFDYDVQAASDEAVIPVDQIGESLTVQSMAEDADINVLMKRFGITGKMPESPRIPRYGDFIGISDFQSALAAVSEAFEGFMQLPADLRARFGNDPQQLLQFCGDDANIEEARKLGLLKESSSVGAAVGGEGPGGAVGVQRGAAGGGVGQDAASVGGGASGVASGGAAGVAAVRGR